MIKRLIFKRIYMMLLLGHAPLLLANDTCYKINEEAKSAELLHIALAGFLDKEVLSSSIENFSYKPSAGVPECPDQMSYFATVNVKYKTLKLLCSVVLSVIKKENWGHLQGNSYEFFGHNSSDCVPQ